MLFAAACLYSFNCPSVNLLSVVRTMQMAAWMPVLTVAQCHSCAGWMLQGHLRGWTCLSSQTAHTTAAL